jgi:hypothetical protein
MQKHKSGQPTQRGRDAKTGRFSPLNEARRRRATAVVETITRRRRKK